MALFQNWPGCRGIMQFLIVKLVCWLAWLSSVSLAQLEFGEGITGSVNFPSLGITCVGNLAVFVTSLIRGRLDLEIGARDALDILRNPKLKDIDGMNGEGLTTEDDLEAADVVLLSNGTPNSSIILEFRPLQEAVTAAAVTVEQCTCLRCHCIAFPTVEKITTKLAPQMPGTFKLLSNSLCLLPCVSCLGHHCHGCNQGNTLVEGRLPQEQADDSKVVSEILDKISAESIQEQADDSKVVSEILDKISAESIRAREPICICIPLHDASRDDVWTNLLVRSFRSKDADGRGVRVMASEALEGYLAGGRGRQHGTVEYIISSFILPRLTEVVINLVLTFWFKVDGFSSSLVARRTIRDFLVDTKGSGFAANAFLTEATVLSDNNNTQVCQMLRFRGNVVGIRSLSFIVGCVNLFSSLAWAVLISFKCGVNSSHPPSMPILVVMIAAIGTALGMDVGIGRWKNFNLSGKVLMITIIAFSPVSMPMLLLITWRLKPEAIDSNMVVFMAAVVLEVTCIVSGITVAGIVGMKGFGRWIYGAFQILVWVKWAAGSYMLNNEISVEFFGKIPQEWAILTYSSAFLLNAVLAGVRCKWEPWPWKENRLFPGIAGPTCYNASRDI